MQSGQIVLTLAVSLISARVFRVTNKQSRWMRMWITFGRMGFVYGVPAFIITTKCSSSVPWIQRIGMKEAETHFFAIFLCGFCYSTFSFPNPICTSIELDCKSPFLIKGYANSWHTLITEWGKICFKVLTDSIHSIMSKWQHNNLRNNIGDCQQSCSF